MRDSVSILYKYLKYKKWKNNVILQLVEPLSYLKNKQLFICR